MKLRQRTILITGGSSGIGLELARQLLARGNTVIVTGRDQDKLDEARRQLPGLHAFQSDVTDPGAIEALYRNVTAKFPTLDTLVNNAGIMRNLKLDQSRSLTDVTREIDIGLSGPVRMVQQFLSHLRTQRNSLIINVSSGLAFVPFPVSPIYSAAKAALHAYTRCLRAQLDGSGVTVIELAPPGTETELFRGEFAEETRGQRGMNPVTLVRSAIRGIEAGKSEIRPGPSNILKILSRVAPNFIFKQMIQMSRLQTRTH